MKTLNKRFLIISTAVMGLGLILIFCSLLMVNFNVMALDLCGEPKKVIEEYPTDKIKSISVNLASTDVIVRKTNLDKIRFIYYTTDCCPSEVEDTGENLTLSENFDYGLKQLTKGVFHGIRKYGLKVIIEIPDTLSGSKLEDFEIKIRLFNGNIDISDVSANNITAKTSNGSIYVKNINSYQNIDVSTSNGGIYLSYIDDINGKINALTSNGMIDASEITAKNLDCKTSNGSIEFSYIITNIVSAGTSNGNIDVKNIKSDDIKLETSNGYINGNIVGNPKNYQVSSSTSNGNNSLEVYNNKNEELYKKLDVHTSNGDISVKFSDEALTTEDDLFDEDI